GALFSRHAGHKCYAFIARICIPRISKRSEVMESLACCNEMKAVNAQRNNQLNKYLYFILLKFKYESKMDGWSSIKPALLVILGSDYGS
ncbi:MAG: hypothetical protein JXR70_14480, partial [Spirochaetales bacterium]|nr:hypothetical protein [Spirochaetales bacterium]